MESTPDMIACVMQLTTQEPIVLERTQGHRAHGLFLNIIQHTDPELARQLHATQAVKPWTLAPLQEHTQRLRPGEEYQLRLCFLQADLYRQFARSFLQGSPPPLQLGSATLRLNEIVASSAHPWAGGVAWHELIGRARPAETITLQFATPTAFSLGENAQGRKRVGLFPDGETVFKSLLRRWNACAPHAMDADLLDDVDILPAQYELQTHMLQFSKSRQVGFTGRVTYAIDASETTRHLLAALADAAFYLGVGYKTTQGMGLVRRLA